MTSVYIRMEKKNKKDKNTLILGIGNPILTDDSAGLKVVEYIKENIVTDDVIDFFQVSESGISILDIISGYKNLILVDVIKTDKDEEGTLRKWDISDFSESINLSSPHRLNFPSVIELAQKTDTPIPDNIEIYTIEVKDIYTISEKCSEEIIKKIPELAKNIIKISNILE